MHRAVAVLCYGIVLVSANTPSIKWGQSKSQLFLTFTMSCSPSEMTTRISGDELWFECGTYLLQGILRGSCTTIDCKANSQSVNCVLTKKENRIWDRFTHSEKDLERFGGKLSIDYRRWEEPSEKDDADIQEHTYGSSKLVQTIESDLEFRKVLDMHPVIVVDMSMKWCALCVDKIKQVLNAARTMKKEAYFVHLDTQEARSARMQYNITCDSDCAILWVFAKNEEAQRITQGNSDVEKMVRAYISPPMTHFVDINAFNAFQNQGGHSIVGVFVGDPDFTEYGKLTRAMRGSETRFGFQFGIAGQHAFGIPRATIPCLISKTPNGTELLTDMRVSSMTDFIKTRNLPLFPIFDYSFRPKVEKMTLYDGRKLPIGYYWTQNPLLEPEFLRKPEIWNDEEDGEWSPEPHIPAEVIGLAQEFRSKVYFVRAESYTMRDFGLQDNLYPAFGIASSAEYEPSARYALSVQGANLTTDAIRTFVNDFLQRKLAPAFKSAALPTTSWTPGVVHPVVASNVEQTIDQNYDVFVYLYPGWKKDEKASASIALVAQSLATVPQVKLVSMDMDANYVNPQLFPGLDKWSTTPSLYLFAKPEEGGDKLPVRYSGKVGQSEILVWLKQHSLRVAEQWSLVKAQAKKMKEDITLARAKLKAGQDVEAQRIASLPKIDVSGDGGVIKQILQRGEGNAPPRGATVHAHYTGTLLTGEKFDSSRDRGTTLPFELGAGSVIKCWDLAFATMQKGERAMLTCPPLYAYGENAMGAIPAGATLQFDVELVAWDSEAKATHLEL